MFSWLDRVFVSELRVGLAAPVLPHELQYSCVVVGRPGVRTHRSIASLFAGAVRTEVCKECFERKSRRGRVQILMRSANGHG